MTVKRIDQYRAAPANRTGGIHSTVFIWSWIWGGYHIAWLMQRLSNLSPARGGRTLVY
jgi:hypothetical protein